MQITDIRVRKLTKEGKMKAVVSVTFDNADMRDRLQSEILAKYEEAVKEIRENETAEE